MGNYPSAKSPMQMPEGEESGPESTTRMADVLSQCEPATVTFIRHALAEHNINPDDEHKVDTQLIPEGIQQCISARDGEAGRLMDEADLIIVSPLRRALKTAELLSGERDDAKFLVTPLCVERPNMPCDSGSFPEALIQQFPYIAEHGLPAQGIASLAERWWPRPTENQPKRVRDFLHFLLARPEHKIVVVSHGDYLSWIHDPERTFRANSPLNRLRRFMHNTETLTMREDELRAIAAHLGLEAAEEDRCRTLEGLEPNDWWLSLTVGEETPSA